MPTDVAPQKPGEVYRVLPDDRWAFFFDHHTIKSLTTCEQIFQYRHRRHLRAKGPTRSVLSIGSWWSDVMEDFYNLMACGKPMTRVDAITLAASAWNKRGLESMSCDGVNDKKYTKFAMPTPLREVASTLNAPGEWLQHLFQKDLLEANDPRRDTIPFGPLLMAIRYFDTYYEVDSRNWTIIAAEKGFGLKGEVIVGEDKNNLVYYIGKPDLVVFDLSSETLFPLDHKSNEYIPWDIQKKWKPHPQTAGYIYAVGLLAREMGIDRVVDRCIINAAARNEPSDKPKDGKVKPRFTRVMPSYSPQEIVEWQRQIMWKAARLRHCIENDEWIWKEDSCHLFGGCDYRRVCSQPPGVRELVLQTDFVEVEPWSPYEVEEKEEEAV